VREINEKAACGASLKHELAVNLKL